MTMDDLPSAETPSGLSPIGQGSSNTLASDPPKIRDKGKGRAKPIQASEIPPTTPPPEPLYALRGRKCDAPEEDSSDSDDDNDDDDDADDADERDEDSGEEEVMPKKSDISATPSMPQVHVELPSPPKGKNADASTEEFFTARGTVWYSNHSVVFTYSYHALRICVDDA